MEDHSGKSNVVLFPQKEYAKVIPPKTEKEVFEAVSSVKEMHVYESIDYLFEGLIGQISMLGFPITESTKAHAFLKETMISVLKEYYGLPHPIQHIIEKAVVEEDDGLYIDSSFCFKKKRTVKKKPKEPEASEL